MSLHPRGHRGRRFWAAGFALVLFVAGCGESPTAPVISGGTPAARGPEVLKISAGGSTSFVPMPIVLQAPALDPNTLDMVYDPRRALTVSAKIDGAVGGRLLCGPYVLTFPAGAFEGVGTISMTMPDSTIMLCDLEILPTELNDFREPVDLALHTSGTDADLDSLQMYWWDEDESDWVDMGCQRSTDLERLLDVELLTTDPAKGVQLQLQHFSRYATGKAGW